MHLMSLISPRRQQHTSILSWRRQSSSRQVETAVLPFSPTHPPVVATKGLIATSTSVLLKLDCMHWGCTTSSLPTGFLGPTPPMSLGSQVGMLCAWGAQGSWLILAKSP